MVANFVLCNNESKSPSYTKFSQKLLYTANVLSVESTDNACKPNPNSTFSDFNRLKSVIKKFYLHAIFEM